MKRRSGFTIIELLMVIGVLAVLVTIVTMAASAAIRKGRTARASAMASAIQNGLSTYKNNHDAWPGVLEDWAKEGRVSGADTSGGARENAKIGILNDADYDKVMQILLQERKSGKSVMDFGALIAGPKSATNGRQNGIDYRVWVQRKKDAGKSGSARLPGGMDNENSLTFGYAGTENGKFYRFKIEYNADADSVTVSTR